ncbi:Slp family lipoprotein [Paraglaciecola aquimarina]|uniref:Slp family lipoprotein n=1 Tax=Paraglaciecola algarum TaxID=3050085 RepID=A0ABS9DBN8_9ALTE|nr:Slp family lipoprotein [Paraglaciecola sp. G1-23]MCF2949770.1 Slp family lipoprotein [Paraglaciecola sp. G1-23]
MFIRVCLFFSALFLAGCATFPEKLQVADPSQLVTYQDAASKAEQVKGKSIRWGGAIAKIENKEESTILEMVYYPLTSYGRPISADESMGRYRIHINGFMDPMVYQVGRLMTFTGELQGVENGLVGEHKYVFPSVVGTNYYLWKKLQRIDISRVDIWPHDYWFNYYPRPYRSRLIIRSSNNSSSNGQHSGSVSRPSTSRPSGASTLPKPVRGSKEIR